LLFLSWVIFLIDLPICIFIILQACGLSNPIDGSADDKIACFKPDGSIGERGLDVLREMRARAGDGHNEHSQITNEEAVAEYGGEEAGAGFGVDLNNIEDEIDLFFDIDP